MSDMDYLPKEHLDSEEKNLQDEAEWYGTSFSYVEDLDMEERVAKIDQKVTEQIKQTQRFFAGLQKNILKTRELGSEIQFSTHILTVDEAPVLIAKEKPLRGRIAIWIPIEDNATTDNNRLGISIGLHNGISYRGSDTISIMQSGDQRAVNPPFEMKTIRSIWAIAGTSSDTSSPYVPVCVCEEFIA